MTKLAKYLKPFAHLVLAGVLLLFAQAYADLSLPRYMADIVNVGIQQQGVESGAPEALTAADYTFLSAVLTGTDKAAFQDAYKEITTGSTVAADYEGRYPVAADGDIYVLQARGDAAAAADTAYLAAVETLLGLGKETGISADSSSAASIDTAALLPLLSQMDESALAAARETGAGMAMSDSLAVYFTGTFYQNLGMDLNDLQQSYIFHIGWIMLGLSLLAGTASMLVGLVASRTAAGVAANLRSDMFRKVSSFSDQEFDHFSTASLITRTTNDINQIFILITMGMRLFFYAPVMAVGGITMAVRTSVSVSWILALIVILLLLLVFIIFKLAMPKFKILQSLTDRLNLVSRENLTGLMVIRAFGNQDFEGKRYDKANVDLMKVNLFVGRVMIVMMPTMMFLMNMASVLIIWVGAQQIADSAMQVGDMMAFMQYTMQVIMSFLFMSMLFILVPRASVSAGRIHEVLTTEPAISDPERPADAPEGDGEIVFDDVSFRYAGAAEDVLRHISFTARAGETTAIIGPTGSGKSTVLQLIPRFYDVTAGTVRINGVDVRTLRRKDLRRLIGYVPQKGALLTGTIAENIAYGNPDLPEEEILRIAGIAQAGEIIEEKEEGIHSSISQGGANVSGGQKQRLAIARALAKKAKVFLFDDSFSALDFKTDSALRQALAGEIGGSVQIIVAQRVSSIIKADQIIVMEKGEVVGIGKHEELMKDCPTYREIAQSQLPEEETA